MGGVLCGASDPTGRVGALGALDEAYGRPPKAKKGEEPAESFVERLCKFPSGQHRNTVVF